MSLTWSLASSRPTSSIRERVKDAPLLGELPGVRRGAADAPSRHHDFRVSGLLEEHRAWQPDRDFRFIVGHDARDARYPAILFPAIIQLDDRDDIRHRSDKCADDRLYHHDIAMDDARARGFEPSDVHRL